MAVPSQPAHSALALPASPQRTPPTPQLSQFKVLQSRGAPAQRALFVGPPGVR